ncbi:MAG TPA: hypothetical protein VGO04_07835 [Ensifer sp.]|uniref:hypothetical protein n=1 Tax=Ensifer sp. TaxID=1872086 RepID=UPI002E0F91F2|nr:hypothetical protein [Ensifer sp.]
MDYEQHLPAPAETGLYFPDALILYGVKLNSNDDYGKLSVGQPGVELRFQLFAGSDPLTNGQFSVVLAYGYAFDGHCYRLDSNRMFIVAGVEDQDPIGCGFDAQPTGSSNGYRMWRIQSSTQILEITTSVSDAKTLILDANLPGKKSPTSYAITQSMAHRNGRLARD